MFDVGFSELIIIGVVALIVVGPERLPKVARTAGHLIGRLQRYVNDVKEDINREIQFDALKKLQNEVRDSVYSFERQITEEIASVESSVHDTFKPLYREEEYREEEDVSQEIYNLDQKSPELSPKDSQPVNESPENR